VFVDESDPLRQIDRITEASVIVAKYIAMQRPEVIQDYSSLVYSCSRSATYSASALELWSSMEAREILNLAMSRGYNLITAWPRGHVHVTRRRFRHRARCIDQHAD
jgi:hypothetical protein